MQLQEQAVNINLSQHSGGNIGTLLVQLHLDRLIPTHAGTNSFLLTGNINRKGLGEGGTGRHHEMGGPNGGENQRGGL